MPDALNSFDISTIAKDEPVLIAGPTASGKSALALRIAESQGGIIVNADALQVFAGWRVLTARPDDADLRIAPHHLYGHVPLEADYSVGHWLREVTPFLSHGPLPIIVGGTGLYFTALTEGLAEIPPTPTSVRARGDAMSLPDLLADLDHATTSAIDVQNRARVQRAWEVQTTTGRSIRDWQDNTPPPLLPLAACTALALMPEVDWLNGRIEQRFDMMMKAGARAEAEAIALRLRVAAQDGITAALISPDRMLTRQVTAALDRWDIQPDDSAGTPLALSPPGRLLRHVADLFGKPVTGESLLTLLKHPLCNSETDVRGPHLRFARELELRLRRKGPPFPTYDTLTAWARDTMGADGSRLAWAQWIGELVSGLSDPCEQDLAAHLSAHISLAERLSGGPNTRGSGGLWKEAAGREALRICDNLRANADALADQLDWVVGDAMALPFEDNQFDVYTISFGIRNVTRPQKALDEAFRVLRPGGRLLIIDFAPHELEFLRETHAHRRLGFAHDQMQRWLEALNLEMEQVTDLAPQSDAENKLTVTLWLARDPRIVTDLPVADPTREVA